MGVMSVARINAEIAKVRHLYGRPTVVANTRMMARVLLAVPPGYPADLLVTNDALRDSDVWVISQTAMHPAEPA